MLKKKGHMGKTITFESKEDRELFLSDYNSLSLTEKIFSKWMYQSKYDTKKIKFKENIIKELLKKDLITEERFSYYNFDLEKLHLCLKPHLKNLDESEQNEISISFYETSDIIKETYIEFIKKIISPLFSEEIYYQVVPTFRFHFPNQKGYEWQDRYHTDIMLGHPPYEFNLWIPFTNVYGTNSMRLMPFTESKKVIESCNKDFELFAEKTQYDEAFIHELKKSSSPLEMNYGDFIIFDPRCLHCTQYNDTKDTRISMDIRIIMKSALNSYSREYKTTGRKKMPFLPGHYFSKHAV